jgi:hypothetical protein
MSSSSSTTVAAMILHPMVEKLSKNNHTMWRAQVLATLRGVRLEGFITGKKKAPPEELEGKDGDKNILVSNLEYEDWLTGDQQVLSFLLASVSKEILVRIAMAPTTEEAWKKLEEQFTSQTRACAISMRMALATTRKGSTSVAEYLAKM